MRILVLLLILGVVGYATVCVALYFNQDRMLFFPSVLAEAELTAIAREEGFEVWRNAAGQPIGWKSPARDPDADALLICHGNGGFALGRNYATFRRGGDSPFQVFLLEYPGYGARPGTISAQSLVAAAVEAVDTLKAENPTRRVFLFGQSLGTGIVSSVAAERPEQVAGIVLVTPFDSLAGAAAFHYPWLPVRALVRHRLDSDRNLPRFRGPVAFVVAGKDTTTPPHLGQRLFDLYAGPKRLWLIPDAGHNDFDALLADWPAMRAWLTQARSRDQEPSRGH